MNSSLFTLGAAQLGMSYGLSNKVGKLNVKQAFRVLDEAIEQGVRSFDTASGYGDSEKILGDYFKQNQGIDHEITTKLQTIVLDPGTTKDMAIRKADEFVSISLERLRLSSIPVLLFHSYDDLAWEDGFLLDQLKKSETVGKVGVSVYTPEQAANAATMEGISVIQLPTNLMDMRFINKGVFELAKKKGIRIYIRSLYLQGLILMEKEDIPPFLMESRPFLKRLKEISKKSDLSLQELTISFINSIQGKNRIVIGCETAEQVMENARLVRSVSRMSQEMQQVVSETMLGVPDSIINPSLWKENVS